MRIRPFTFERGPLLIFAVGEQWWYMAEFEAALTLVEGRGIFAKLEYVLEQWRLGVGIDVEFDWFLAELEVYVGPFTLSLGWWSVQFGDLHSRRVEDWEDDSEEV